VRDISKNSKKTDEIVKELAKRINESNKEMDNMVVAMRDIENSSKNIKNIENGNLKYKLEVIGDDEISTLAKSINNITGGLETAVDANIKNERMKAELITNVSHDLKTPLTSILSYVDMLKNNDFDRETINDYINILDKKSQRLKLLIDDIFEHLS